MADATPGRDAGAQQILAALKKLDAEITAARTELANLERQIPGLVGAAGGGTAAPRTTNEIRAATQALEAENAAARQGLDTELQRLDAIKAQAAERRAGALELAAPGYAPSARVAGQSLEAERLAAQAQAQEAARARALRASIVVPDDRRFTSNAGQRLEDQRGVQQQQERDALLTQEQSKQDAIAAIQARRNELAQQEVATQRQAEVLRAQQALKEQDIAASIEFANQELARQNALIAEAAALPAAQRGAYIRQGLAQPQPYGAPGSGASREGATAVVPYTQRDLGEFTSQSHGVDDAQRLEQTRQRVSELSRAETEYAAATQTSSAMSSQFIGRLASGDASLREFGSNLAETTSKFGGWVAAGAGVYSLIGILGELTKGAKDSSSGVNQLSRSIDDVDPAKAQQGFRQVSSELNVSIKDVADAQFQMSRTFNNQTDSLTGAKVALEAYKLDNVNTADAVRTLTAVHNQFGVTAGQLPAIFDQLDRGQQKFNARVGESMAALTRASAAVKNAGGDLQGLIPIVEYGVRVSGQSGNVIGNALARSASRFVPKNAQEIKQLGLDPTQGYTALITEAIQKASTMSGQQRTQLAQALGGPQLGSRVFEPLLGASSMFNQILQNVSPEKAKGAAQEELNSKLSQTDEQLKKVVNGFQRLGSALAQSGAFGGLGAALEVVNFMLSSLTKIVEVFDELPASVRPWIAGLLEVAAILKVLRATNIGASIADATGMQYLGPNATERARRSQVSGLTTEATAYESGAASAMTRSRASAAEAGVQQQIAQQARLDADQAATQEERDALIQKSLAAETEAGRLLQQSAAQDEIAVKLRQDALDARTQILALQKREMDVDAELVATQQAQGNRGGWWGAGGTRSWTGRKVQDPAASAEDAAASQTGAAAATDAAASKRFAGAQARKVTAEEELAAADTEAAAAAEASALAANEAATASTGAAASMAQAATQTAAAGARFGGGVLRWLDGLGLFSKALTAFIIGQMFFDRVKQESDAMNKANDDLTKGVQNVGDLHAQQQRAQAQSRAREPFAASLFDAATHPSVFGFHPFGETNAESQRQAGASAAAMDASIQRARQRSAASPVEQVGYSYQELLAEEQADIDALNKHHISKSEFNRRYAEILKSMGVSLDVLTGDGKGLKDAQTRAAQMFAQAMEQQTPTNDPFSQFDKASIDENLAFLGSITDREKYKGAGAGDFETISRGLQYMQGKYGGSQDKQTIQKLNQAFAALDTFISQQSDQFKAVLAEARYAGPRVNPAAIDAGTAIEGLGQEQRAQDAAYDQYVKKLTDERKKLSARLGANSQAVQKITAELAQAQEQQYQSDVQNIDVREKYNESTATDKSQAIADKIKADGELVQLAFRYTGPDKWQKILEALAQQNQDIAAQAQQHLQDIQLSGDVRTSSIQTLGPAGDLARLQSQLQTARQKLAAAYSEAPNQNKHDDILNAQREVNDLNLQIAQTVQTQQQNADKIAQDLYDSQMAIKLAQAGDDPIAKDRLTIQQDTHDLQSINPRDFQTTAEYQAARNKALAKVIGDRRQLVTDHAQRDLDNAKFEHDIGQLTDQQYISQLRKILEMKQLTTQMRQSILLQIYQLQHQDQGALELNAPGGIRAPSMYEVVKSMRVNAGRRVGSGAIVASGPMIHQTNHNTFNFNFRGGSKSEIGNAIAEALDKATGGSAIANLRAAGAI